MKPSEYIDRVLNEASVQEKIKQVLAYKPEYKDLPVNALIEILNKSPEINTSTYVKLDQLLNYVKSPEYEKQVGDETMGFVHYMQKTDPATYRKMAQKK